MSKVKKIDSWQTVIGSSIKCDYSDCHETSVYHVVNQFGKEDCYCEEHAFREYDEIKEYVEKKRSETDPFTCIWCHRTFLMTITYLGKNYCEECLSWKKALDENIAQDAKNRKPGGQEQE